MAIVDIDVAMEREIVSIVDGEFVVVAVAVIALELLRISG